MIDRKRTGSQNSALSCACSPPLPPYQLRTVITSGSCRQRPQTVLYDNPWTTMVVPAASISPLALLRQWWWRQPQRRRPRRHSPSPPPPQHKKEDHNDEKMHKTYSVNRRHHHTQQWWKPLLALCMVCVVVLLGPAPPVLYEFRSHAARTARGRRRTTMIRQSRQALALVQSSSSSVARPWYRSGFYTHTEDSAIDTQWQLENPSVALNYFPSSIFLLTVGESAATQPTTGLHLLQAWRHHEATGLVSSGHVCTTLQPRRAHTWGRQAQRRKRRLQRQQQKWLPLHTMYCASNATHWMHALSSKEALTPWLQSHHYTKSNHPQNNVTLVLFWHDPVWQAVKNFYRLPNDQRRRRRQTSLPQFLTQQRQALHGAMQRVTNAVVGVVQEARHSTRGDTSLLSFQWVLLRTNKDPSFHVHQIASILGIPTNTDNATLPMHTSRAVQPTNDVSKKCQMWQKAVATMTAPYYQTLQEGISMQLDHALIPDLWAKDVFECPYE